MSNESWTVYTLKLTAEVAARASCNVLQPGSGAAVDFVKAAKDCYYGNYSGAALNLFFGSLDLATYGFSTAVSTTLKDAAQKSGKDAVIQVAKEKAKTDGKKLVGKQVAKGLAKGGVEQAVNEAFSASTKFTFKNMRNFVGFSFISSGGHEVPKTIFEDTFRYFGEPAFEHILKGGVKQNAQSFSSEWMKTAAGRAARENFIQYSSRKFLWDFHTSVTKGVINRRLKAQEN